MIAPPHLIIFTRETKPGTHKPIRFLVPFAISFITNQCDDDKLNKAIFLHHTILCLYCYFNFVSQREDCFGQVWYVIVFPSKWHFIVCISVLNVYGNKIELLLLQKTKTAITQLIDTCDTINIMNKVLYEYMYTLLERYKETELSILTQKVNSMMFEKVFLWKCTEHS